MKNYLLSISYADNSIFNMNSRKPTNYLKFKFPRLPYSMVLKFFKVKTFEIIF